jgi:hypothetical protein
MGRDQSRGGSGGRRDGPPRSTQRERRPQARLQETGDASSAGRMFLALLAHEGKIWNVYLSDLLTGGSSRPPTLQFERTGEDEALLRFEGPVPEPLLDALQAGEPVSRGSLRAELDHALRRGGLPSDPADDGTRVRPWRALGDSSGSGGTRS